MFTGIVEELGTVEAVRSEGGGRRLRLRASRVLADLKPEDSLLVNGVCLTVTAVGAGLVELQAVGETLSKTTLGGLASGAAVHLERALTLQTRLGGHFVQGHVDCTGRVTRLERATLGMELELAFPHDFLRFTARTGSICLDGVSLTVAGAARREGSEGRARVALIPYTLEHTTLGRRRPGDALNVEFDCLAKVVEQLLQHGAARAPGEGPGGLSWGTLTGLGT
ncbi:MAG: riboflavin synthase [bacterium]|jgi:riboflavin synthase|nr:riboflavin synthase [bacterium]